jgi:hypothetical protein
MIIDYVTRQDIRQSGKPHVKGRVKDPAKETSPA